MDYRFKKYPSDIQLKINRIIKKEVQIDLTISQGLPFLFRFLSKLNFVAYLEIKRPHGLILNNERTGTDFNKINENAARLLLDMDLNLDGRRKLTIYVQKDSNSSFQGGSAIVFSYYVGRKDAKHHFCRKIFGTIQELQIQII